ncbi:MAG: hypothetical protein ACYDCP_06115 [Thermoplasmataceae archaeon]|jgi:hypothetical protein
MAWYSKLKSFIDSILHVDISTIRVNSQNVKLKAKNSIVIINNPDKDPLSFDKNGERVTINLDKLEKEQQEELGIIIKEAFEEDRELFKENLLGYVSELEDYNEEDPDKELLAYFREKLTKEDFEILRISLFLRSRYRLKENVSKIKEDIVKKFGDRGKNIANLCSTEYFENFIKPLWEVIHKSIEDKETADREFYQIFELIVKNGLLAVFVHHYLTADKLSSLISKRIEESVRYGFAMVSEQLYIHALSRQNVTTVVDWVENHGVKIKAKIIVQGNDFITVAIPIDHELVEEDS